MAAFAVVAAIWIACLLVSGAVLRRAPLGERSQGERVRWWLAGFLIPAVLVLGTLTVCEARTQPGEGSYVLGAVVVSVVLLVVGHFRTPDRRGWWTGAAGFAFGWVVWIGLLWWALSHLGPDF